jgi:hypothetical protein
MDEGVVKFRLRDLMKRVARWSGRDRIPQPLEIYVLKNRPKLGLTLSRVARVVLGGDSPTVDPFGQHPFCGARQRSHVHARLLCRAERHTRLVRAWTDRATRFSCDF